MRCSRFYVRTLASIALVLAQSAVSPAQTFTTLAYFGDSFSRFTSFVQGRDGNLYGTVIDYNNGYGSVLTVTPSGALTVLHNFCAQPNCTDGADPGPIMLATDGNFYGTTYYGGATCAATFTFGCGTVFRITPEGVFTILHTFNGTDGNEPTWLIEGSDRNLYGTTTSGGSSSPC